MDSDEDTFDYADSMEVDADCSTDKKPKTDNYEYEILTPEEILRHMDECIKEVNTVIGIPETTARILLNHFKWDKAKLMEKYYDGDQEALFKEAHVINPFKKLKNKRMTRSSRTRREECEICCSECPPSMMAGLECNHKFCKGCWRDYLTTKIMEDGLGQSITCAAHDCDIIVDDVTVTKLIMDPRVKSKYQNLITNSFVECNRLLRWCPSPDCTYTIKVNSIEFRPTKCKCGHVFCFECGENWHDPVLCLYLKKWIKKCNDDSETANWVAANTKECPKCHVRIEKNGGCNHMHCTNNDCKFDFCWFCLGALKLHGVSGYKCNQYQEDNEKVNAKEKSRTSLARYLHYYNRYVNHMQSLKFEHELYASVKAKMDEMQTLNIPWIDVQFLNQAVDILCQCRQTLMYTYVFAFYLAKNNQSIIFEDNQSDLEIATEKLSEYLERELTDEELLDIKQKVLDKTGYCEKRRATLLDHVYEGYEDDWWEYSH